MGHSGDSDRVLAGMLLYGFFCYRVLMAGGLAATKVERPRSGLIADLRRAVPAPLESAVKRPASIPAVRRLYRRVTR